MNIVLFLIFLFLICLSIKLYKNLTLKEFIFMYLCVVIGYYLLMLLIYIILRFGGHLPI